MESAKQQVLRLVEDELCLEVSEGQALLAKLRSTGSSISRMEPADTSSSSGKHTWLLFLQPPRALRERFDLAPEVLLVLAPWPVTQARDITAAERILGRDHRLDRGVVLHVSKDPLARQDLNHAIGRTGRLYVMMTFDDVLRAEDPEAWFRRTLGESIAQSNLFAAGRPVFGWDFVGREQELRALRGRLLDGRPVGLFGLRKVGKTSLLLSMRDQWMRDAEGADAVVHAVPIHIDLLAVSFAETNLDGILRLVLQATKQVVDELCIELPPGAHRADAAFPRLHGQALRERVVSILQGLLDWSRQQRSRPPVLLLIDEYERLLGAARVPIDDGLDFLDFLRGLVQQHPKAFNFLVAGLRRDPAAKSRYGSRQNPLFGFLVEEYLAGLERVDMGELVRKIGRRLGLRVDRGALDVLWAETGGHPYLVREYGGIMDSGIPVEARKLSAKVVDASLATAMRGKFLRSVDNTMQEVCEAIRELDPHALDALVRSGTKGLSAQTAELLCRYGVLAPCAGGHRFRIGAFESWLAHNHVGLSMVSGG